RGFPPVQTRPALSSAHSNSWSIPSITNANPLHFSARGSIIVQAGILAVTSTAETASHSHSLLIAAHRAQQVTHVFLDLFRIFARFQAADRIVHFLGHSPGRHHILHLPHHVRHVLGIVLVHVIHVALQLAHRSGNLGIVEIRHC